MRNCQASLALNTISANRTNSKLRKTTTPGGIPRGVDSPRTKYHTRDFSRSGLKRLPLQSGGAVPRAGKLQPGVNAAMRHDTMQHTTDAKIGTVPRERQRPVHSVHFWPSTEVNRKTARRRSGNAVCSLRSPRSARRVTRTRARPLYSISLLSHWSERGEQRGVSPPPSCDFPVHFRKWLEVNGVNSVLPVGVVA